MYIPASRLRRLHAVTERLTSSLNGREVREFAAEAVLDLMRADYLASYVWDPVKKRFGERVMLNMDPANLPAYERHYQFCDPITPALQRRRRATPDAADRQSAAFVPLNCRGMHSATGDCAAPRGSTMLWMAAGEPDVQYPVLGCPLKQR